LIQGCNHKSETEPDRFHHLQDVHGYPKWFRFHSKAKEIKKNHDGGKQRMGNQKIWNHSDLNNASSSACASIRQQEAMEEGDNDRKERRNQRRRERNKIIPCRFHHSKKGCRKGELCTFLHGDDGNDEKNVDQPMHLGAENLQHINCNITADIDMDVDDLTKQIEQSVRISIPNNISFGRRRR